MTTWAVLLAAGNGTRLADAVDGLPKQFLDWHGEPLYMASARIFAACVGVCGLVFVFPEKQLDTETRRVETLAASLGLPWRCVAGGLRRQDSVRLAVAALPGNCDAVLVHDAARPFLSPALVVRVLRALRDNTGQVGVIPGVPVTDTIKIVRDSAVADTPPRETLVAVQTPQGFRLDALRQAHDRAEAEGWDVTDDAALLERCGHAVLVVEGERDNRKITNPEDLCMLTTSTGTAVHGETRVGYGYDVHRYVDADDSAARPLRLGGVLLEPGRDEKPMAVQAHSDGDVLLHALMDAVLGGFGGGDIGLLFPDNKAEFAGVSSAALLDEVLSRARAAGFTPRFADLTVVAQKPRISPHREAIRANVARLMGLPAHAVNVKATTEEGLGFTGTVQGIKAVAVVTGIFVQRK